MIATCFALTGFAAAGLTNIAVGNDVLQPHIWWRVMAVMLASWLIGLIVGHYMQKTVVDHVEKYKREHPIPDDLSDVSDDMIAQNAKQKSVGVEPSE